MMQREATLKQKKPIVYKPLQQPWTVSKYSPDLFTQTLEHLLVSQQSFSFGIMTLYRQLHRRNLLSQLSKSSTRQILFLLFGTDPCLFWKRYALNKSSSQMQCIVIQPSVTLPALGIIRLERGAVHRSLWLQRWVFRAELCCRPPRGSSLPNGSFQFVCQSSMET